MNLPIPSLEKSDVVRSDNRFGKSNPGISATMKCFWIPTQGRSQNTQLGFGQIRNRIQQGRTQDPEHCPIV